MIIKKLFLKHKLETSNNNSIPPDLRSEIQKKKKKKKRKKKNKKATTPKTSQESTSTKQRETSLETTTTQTQLALSLQARLVLLRTKSENKFATELKLLPTSKLNQQIPINGIFDL